MKKTELIFIPSPGIGHLVSSIEMSKLLINRDQSISITILIMKLPMDTKVNPFTQSKSSNSIQFIHLPSPDISSLSSSADFFPRYIESHKTHVRDVVAARSVSSNQLAGLVVDMFCTIMIDVANEFGLPSYGFFTSSACFLNLALHVRNMYVNENVDLISLTDRTEDLPVPGFVNDVPIRVLPSDFSSKEGWRSSIFLLLVERLKDTKGFIINTFYELEPHAIESLSPNLQIYAVGPVLNLENESNSDKTNIINWLNEQPDSSVVFLCFGSMGSFNKDQVKEIANALERSSYRFLWSLRLPGEMGKIENSGEYHFTEILPDGFLDRTKGVGKVVSWAPQVSVLSHKSVGGFVSHCGWNSILESVWYGVPIATWPLFAEQQINAFQLLKELGLAVEIKMDYKKNFMSNCVGDDILSGEMIESGINKLMEAFEVRKNLEEMRERSPEMRERSRMAMSENGSSYKAIGCLIEDIMKNISDERNI